MYGKNIFFQIYVIFSTFLIPLSNLSFPLIYNFYLTFQLLSLVSFSIISPPLFVLIPRHICGFSITILYSTEIHSLFQLLCIFSPIWQSQSVSLQHVTAAHARLYFQWFLFLSSPSIDFVDFHWFYFERIFFGHSITTQRSSWY
jgi:hypothetical protein